MRVVYQPPTQSLSSEPVYQTAPRIPIRENLLAPDGTVHRIPISSKAPDAWSIISAIQFVIEQFGRDPRIRAATLPLLSTRINNDVRNNANTIANWVMRKMVYLADPDGGEFIQTAAPVLKGHGLRCRI